MPVMSCIGAELQNWGLWACLTWACSRLCVKDRGDTGGMHAKDSIASPQSAVVQTETVVSLAGAATSIIFVATGSFNTLDL